MSEFSAGHQARRIAWAGWIIIVTAGGAAALPLIGPEQGAMVIGGMLVLAGLIETISANQRQQTRKLALLAGAITIIAGVLFTTDQATKFAPSVFVVAGWLFLRSSVLTLACRLEYGSVKFWTGLAAVVDFLLSLVLAAGFSAATLVLSLFGATQPMVAQFAWILAISFIATGAMLLEVARCETSERGKNNGP